MKRPHNVDIPPVPSRLLPFPCEKYCTTWPFKTSKPTHAAAVMELHDLGGLALHFHDTTKVKAKIMLVLRSNPNIQAAQLYPLGTHANNHSHHQQEAPHSSSRCAVLYAMMRRLFAISCQPSRPLHVSAFPTNLYSLGTEAETSKPPLASPLFHIKPGIPLLELAPHAHI